MYPFVLVSRENNVDVFTKNNAILLFDDNLNEINICAYNDDHNICAYNDDHNIYRFFNSTMYAFFKSELSKGTISWNEFINNRINNTNHSIV